jgi:hypothetical protein
MRHEYLRVVCSVHNYPCECGMLSGWHLQVNMFPQPPRDARLILSRKHVSAAVGVKRGGGGVTTADGFYVGPLCLFHNYWLSFFQ